MAAKKKIARYEVPLRRYRKAKRRYAARRKGHVKRGCGKRNWRRGGNAMWKCKVGKKRAYKKKR